jgi:DUF971 family protein
MASLDESSTVPTEIKLHQKSQVLEITFADGNRFELPFELLRVYSPSAKCAATAGTGSPASRQEGHRHHPNRAR